MNKARQRWRAFCFPVVFIRHSPGGYMPPLKNQRHEFLCQLIFESQGTNTPAYECAIRARKSEDISWYFSRTEPHAPLGGKGYWGSEWRSN